jgi:hypothetical protein
MPLRDHFRPPIWKLASWEGFHGGWPMCIVQQLAPLLPRENTAEPRVHLEAYFEIDECAYEDDEVQTPWGNRLPAEPERTTTATAAPPRPTLVVDADLQNQYAYEVLIYDQTRDRQLVAAIEIVSPANKDRPENRRAFVTKCAALLQNGVCISLVDLVTTRQFNLYCDLLALFDATDPAFIPDPPATYATTCRCRNVEQVPKLESWAYPLAVGAPLPPLPIWLSDDLSIMLDLEASYEETCRVLRIP